MDDASESPYARLGQLMTEVPRVMIATWVQADTMPRRKKEGDHGRLQVPLPPLRETIPYRTGVGF